MSPSLLLFPMLSALFAAIFCLFFWQRVQPQRYIFLAGVSSMFVTAAMLLYQVWTEGLQSMQMGQWPAPFGITIVADLLSAIMILITSVSGFLVYIYSLQSIDDTRIKFGYYPVWLFLMFGLCGAFLAGDVFNLYVWMEVMLVSTFVLLTLGGTAPQLEGAIKYVMLNFLASSLLLAGIGVLYGITGTLNMADLSVKLPLVEQQGLVSVAAVFFLIGFGIKAAMFPLYFWLPAAYHTPPLPIVAFIAGLLSKVGIYALLRFFTLVFRDTAGFSHQFLIIMAAFTIISGGLGAIAQTDLRRILAFSIVGQIGYMLLGIGFYTPLALTAVVFFLVHSVLVKTNLFMISGLVYQAKGSYHLPSLGGAYLRYPVLAAMFLVTGFSLVGIPPFSGFWGKLLLVQAGLAAEQYVLTGIALGGSLFTLYYIIRIWNEVFLKNGPELPHAISQPLNTWQLFRGKPALAGATIVLSSVILLIGLYAQPIIELSVEAGRQLLDTEAYINHVLKP
jgi:multicomponent Na+:H+ antiporter subunit D